jgi:folate-binding protein YgfZ
LPTDSFPLLVHLSGEGATLASVTASSNDQIIAGYEALHGAGGAVVVERDVLSVTGPDAARYLQGQLSQDVVAMAGDSAWSFLLAPTGKVVAWLRVHRIDAESYVLETDPGYGDLILTRLKRFLLRTKATIAEPQRCALLQHRWDSSLVRLGDEGREGALVATPVGPHVAGLDELFVDVSVTDPRVSADDAVTDEAMIRYRIAHGIPAMGTELTDDTIPGEAGAWVIDASVSFTKGCYTGQELVARIDSRGNNVPHPIRVLKLDGDASLGDDVTIDGATVGTITSVTPSLSPELPALALARVGRAAVPGTQVAVGSGPSACAAAVVEPGSVR